jgi:hypothetical protein
VVAAAVAAVAEHVEAAVAEEVAVAGETFRSRKG